MEKVTERFKLPLHWHFKNTLSQNKIHLNQRGGVILATENYYLF